MKKLRPATADRWVMEVRPKLVEVAKRRGIITYEELRKLCSYHPVWAGQIVGEVSEREEAQGRPLLSAVVVSKASCMPGAGFFGLPGIPPNLHWNNWENAGKAPTQDLKDRRRRYWKQVLKRVHDWQW